MPGLVPSPDARNLCQQMKALSVHDLRYVRHYLTGLLPDDPDPEPDIGVREPRRPIPPNNEGEATPENWADRTPPDSVAT